MSIYLYTIIYILLNHFILKKDIFLYVDDNHKSEINNENADSQTQDVKPRTNTTSSPKSQNIVPSLIHQNAMELASMFAKTNGKISIQNYKERLKCSAKENEVETRRGKTDFKTEKIGEGRSSSMKSTDGKKCLSDTTNSVAPNDMNDHMESKSLTSRKSFIDSDENEGSFEKMVLSACFSENVRNAFVLNSEEFLDPQDRKCTKSGSNMDAVTQQTDVTENETTIVDSPSTQCFPDNQGVFDHEANLVNPEGNTGVQCFTNGKELDMDQNVPEEGQISLDKDSGFTGCYSECEKRGCHEHNTNFVDLEDILVSSSKTTENKFDMTEDIGCNKGQPLNEDSNFNACSKSDIEKMDI